ncbi:MAG: NAD-dependent epimerase [Denitrovibrio sp.]|nr:MAG: NAD-dependent epimerase [Denitrovibrio sp.]
MKVLVTGTAGFIGFYLAKRLLDRGDTVVGIDNINDYYDMNIKYGRLNETGVNKDDISYGKPVQSSLYPEYRFIQIVLEDRELMEELFVVEKFDAVVNLAAQAGVRYSLKNPHAYVTSNMTGFMNILEGCRHNEVKHLVYASSSSVYGLNESQPFATTDNIDHPISLYAASKKANELMAHSYSYLYNMPTTGLRFFTVYGPWGRPDMALFLFTKAILNNEPIDVFNNGNLSRDFTYIDDIVEGIVKVLDSPAKSNPNWSGENPSPGSSSAPYKVYNIGNSNPVRLMDFIEAIEAKIGKIAEKNMMPMQAGDVPSTHADVSDLERDLDYKPTTKIKDGISSFIDWYRSFYNV